MIQCRIFGIELPDSGRVFFQLIIRKECFQVTVCANMALGFKGPLVVVGILIMLVGHGLNIVMGLLSVVVHGVRLNLLEFSGQLGMEWTGTAYAPFKKLDKIRK